MSDEKAAIDSFIEFATEDMPNLLRELENESDRASALLGAVYLDEWLGELLINFLVDDKETKTEFLGIGRPYAPLGMFAARSTAAFCLGLIDETQYDDLKTIRKIRNKFAHGLMGISFESADIEKECNKLKTRVKGRKPENNRDSYISAVWILATAIKIQATKALQQRRTILKSKKP